MFWWLALATCTRLNSVTKIVCFVQIGQFLKPFKFSLELLWLFIVFPVFYLSQTHQFTLEKPPFVHHFNFNLQEKGMGFLILTIYFMLFAMVFLICEFLLSIVLLGVSDMGLVIFVEFEWMGFVDYDFKMLHFSVIMIEFQYWVCLLICNVLSMSYPLWSILLPYVYFFGDFLVIHSDGEYGSPCLFITWLDYVLGCVP